MLHLNLIRVRSPEEMARAAADMFEDLIRAKPACVLGLATGSTPLPLYRELIAREQGGKIDFSRVRSANLDEYKGLAPNQPQSYRRFMQENLFDHISIKPENTIVPDGLAADIPAMCEAYEHQIEDWGGVDIQLLGLGHDGHIGFNEPGSDDTTITRQVHLDELTRSDAAPAFGGIENVPTTAITMGVATIMGAREVALMAWGEKKASIVKKAVQGPVTVEVAASYLQKHPNAKFLLDKGAASQL